jgi:hypothetical protein
MLLYLKSIPSTNDFVAGKALGFKSIHQLRRRCKIRPAQRHQGWPSGRPAFFWGHRRPPPTYRYQSAGQRPSRLSTWRSRTPRSLSSLRRESRRTPAGKNNHLSVHGVPHLFGRKERLHLIWPWLSAPARSGRNILVASPRLLAASSAHVSGPKAPPDTMMASAGRRATRRSARITLGNA